MPSRSTKNAGAAIAQGAIYSEDKERNGPNFGQGRNPEITDKVVREIRALKDFKKWKIDALSKRYGLSKKQVTRILSCYTAANIYHSERDLPL